jgi:hypothetical protein
MTHRTAYIFTWKTCFLKVPTSTGLKQSSIAIKNKCWVYIYIHHVLHKGTKSQNLVLFHKLCCRVSKTQLSYLDAVHTCPLQVLLLTTMGPAVNFAYLQIFILSGTGASGNFLPNLDNTSCSKCKQHMYHMKPSA